MEYGYNLQPGKKFLAHLSRNDFDTKLYLSKNIGYSQQQFAWYVRWISLIFLEAACDL
jgi:hypothetical protein